MNSGKLYNPTMAYKRQLSITGHKSISISRANTAPARSLTEASFAHFLRRTGQKEQLSFHRTRAQWEAENTSLDMLDEFRDGHITYKPDLTLYYGKDSDGNVIADIIDIKGKEFEADPTQQHLAHIIPASVIGTIQYDEKLKENVYIRSWILLTAQTTRYYDAEHTGENEEGIEARVHRCPECGRIEFHPEHRMTCTCCGHKFTESDEHFDNREMLRAYTEVRTSQSDRAKEAKKLFAANAASKGLQLFDADDYSAARIIRIETNDVNNPIELTPDFSYISQDYRNQPFKKGEGDTDSRLSTMRLQTAVFIFDNLDDDIAKKYLRFLCEHGWNNETAYDAIVIVTADKKFLISERVGQWDKENHCHKDIAKWRAAHWFTCPECGNTYIASSEYPECPFCAGDGINERRAEGCLFVTEEN